MRLLERRLQNLEKIESKSGYHVVELNEWAGETHEEALARAGISPGPDDTVVFIRNFLKPRDKA